MVVWTKLDVRYFVNFDCCMQETTLVQGSQNIRVITASGRLTGLRQPLLFFSYSNIFVKIPITLTEVVTGNFQLTGFEKFL